MPPAERNPSQSLDEWKIITKHNSFICLIFIVSCFINILYKAPTTFENQLALLMLSVTVLIIGGIRRISASLTCPFDKKYSYWCSDFIICLIYTLAAIICHMALLTSSDLWLIYTSSIASFMLHVLFQYLLFHQVLNYFALGCILVCGYLYHDVDNALGSVSYAIIALSILIGWIIRVKLLVLLRKIQIKNLRHAQEEEIISKEVLEILPEGVLILTKDSKIKYFNPAFLAILDSSSLTNLQIGTKFPEFNELIVHNYPSLNSSSAFNELFHNIAENWQDIEKGALKDSYQSNKGFFQLNCDLNKADAESKKIQLKFSVKTLDFENVCLMVFSDVSQRVLIDSLQEKCLYKNKILASVSHELRTPLNGNINFIATAIENPDVPSEVKTQFLTPALRSAKYLLTIINDILDFSQIQANNLRLTFSEKPLIQTVNEALELVDLQVKKKQIQLSLQKDSRIDSEKINTDHTRLFQILLNLLSNALKFTFFGNIILKIEKISPNKYLFSVKDSGTGIDKQDQISLAAQFGKLDSDASINPQGVGLGLMISDRLARLIGPNDANESGIKFTSTKGEGSEFFFTVVNRLADGEPFFGDSSADIFIPVERTFQQERTPPNFLDTTVSSTNCCFCPEILIVDDDSFNVTTLEILIRGESKFKFQSCFNGLQALEAVKKRYKQPCCENCKMYRAIFMDCNMPLMDGYQSAMEVKRFFKESGIEGCKIIACTAYVQESEKSKAISSGMDEYCIKPIDRSKLKTILNNI